MERTLARRSHFGSCDKIEKTRCMGADFRDGNLCYLLMTSIATGIVLGGRHCVLLQA